MKPKHKRRARRRAIRQWMRCMIRERAGTRPIRNTRDSDIDRALRRGARGIDWPSP